MKENEKSIVLLRHPQLSLLLTGPAGTGAEGGSVRSSPGTEHSPPRAPPGPHKELLLHPRAGAAPKGPSHGPAGQRAPASPSCFSRTAEEVLQAPRDAPERRGQLLGGQNSGAQMQTTPRSPPRVPQGRGMRPSARLSHAEHPVLPPHHGPCGLNTPGKAQRAPKRHGKDFSSSLPGFGAGEEPSDGRDPQQGPCSAPEATSTPPRLLAELRGGSPIPSLTKSRAEPAPFGSRRAEGRAAPSFPLLILTPSTQSSNKG